MILLDSSLKSLEIVANSGLNISFFVGYVDIERANFGISDARAADGTSNGTTAVTMVAAPGSNTTRQVKSLSVANDTGSASNVTVRLNTSGTTRTVWTGTLQNGDTLLYTDGRGWYMLNAKGETKIPFDPTSVSVDGLTSLTNTRIFQALYAILVELQMLNVLATNNFSTSDTLEQLREDFRNADIAGVM